MNTEWRMTQQFIFFTGMLLASSVNLAQSGAKAIFEGVEGDYRVVSTGPKVKSNAAGTQPTKKTSVANTNRSEPKYLGLMVSVKLVDETGGATTVSPNRVFRSGERIRLSFKSNKSGYLYVANLGSSGAATLLFPEGGSHFPVKANAAYEVPGNKTFKFVNVPGTDEILVLLSQVPLDSLKLADGSEISTAARNTSPPARPDEQRPASVRLAEQMTRVALADGSKDLVIDEDIPTPGAAPALYAVVDPARAGAAAQKPIVFKLKLKHIQ